MTHSKSKSKFEPASCLSADVERPLSQFASERFVVSDLKGTTPGAVIGELTELLVAASVLPNKKVALDAALSREAILPTVVGNGFAFLHVRGIGNDSIVCAIGLSRAGIAWGAESVHVVVFTTLPERPDPVYLRFMKAFSKSFQSEKKLAKLTSCSNDTEFWDALCAMTRSAFRSV